MNEQTQSHLELIIEQIEAAESMAEDTKVANQLAWVETMNSIRNRAEEIVKCELIITDTAEELEFKLSTILSFFCGD